MTVQAPPPHPRIDHAAMGIPTQSAQTGPFMPAPPKDFEEAGVDSGLVEALILKYLLGIGSATGGEISAVLCLPSEPIVEYLKLLKQQQMVVYTGMSQMSDFSYQLTDAGRERARRFMTESMYVGSAPVPMDDYIHSVQAQSIADVHPREHDLRKAFSDLMITTAMFDVLGPAINSGKGMFLYGYAGNGKTSIAERITRCFGDEIYIPKCLSIDGMIIKLFDAAVHEMVAAKASTIYKKDKIDERWVRIKRPTVIVGGELTMDALEVTYNTTSKTCEAPIQLKSNCGTLVIDDFGRQRIQPNELLNRWIVPLEKRIDFLALPNGKKLKMPFNQLIIFSTNLEPRELCDEAFLRRIPYKINVEDPTEENFRKIFDLVGPPIGFTMDKTAHEAIDYLIEVHFKRVGRPFRACHPRDLLLQVLNRCLYQNTPLTLSPTLFDYAASVYFTMM